MDIAEEHGGKFLLPRRFERRPIGTIQNPDATERDYEACSALVANGWAKWIDGDQGPGIQVHTEAHPLSAVERLRLGPYRTR